jgi:hypothetical protein
MVFCRRVVWTGGSESWKGIRRRKTNGTLHERGAKDSLIDRAGLYLLPTNRVATWVCWLSGVLCQKTTHHFDPWRCMGYRTEATSVEGFVQQIACCYLRHGYWFYVTSRVPKRKDPAAIDAKLVAKYGIAVSESTRARRKQAGIANLQLLRHGRFFVLIATKGQHRFRDEEADRIRDIRLIPIRYGGYSISYRRGGRTRTGAPDVKWHAHVEIERETYLDVRAKFLEQALRQRGADLALAFYELPFERYAPVRRQLLRVLAMVNEMRKQAGMSQIPHEALCLRRRPIKPFGEPSLGVSLDLLSTPELTEDSV